MPIFAIHCGYRLLLSPTQKKRLHLTKKHRPWAILTNSGSVPSAAPAVSATTTSSRGAATTAASRSTSTRPPLVPPSSPTSAWKRLRQACLQQGTCVRSSCVRLSRLHPMAPLRLQAPPPIWDIQSRGRGPRVSSALMYDQGPGSHATWPTFVCVQSCRLSLRDERKLDVWDVRIPQRTDCAVTRKSVITILCNVSWTRTLLPQRDMLRPVNDNPSSYGTH